MPFYPSPSQELLIDDTAYKVAEHPSAPGIPYGQEGRQATVYQLERPDGLRALKVFKERFSTPSLVALADKIAPYASLPGMQVCQRLVLTPSRHRTILKKYPDLTYAVLMPWVEGATWQEVLLEKRALTPEQSLLLTRSLADVLVNLEERGIAHCDLSGPNVIITLDQEHPSVGLVDVEGIYGPGIPQPNELPAGSPGYAHKTGPQGLWDPQADRFAGAVLVAEILGWSDEAVRQLSWGENYFTPDEMQVDSERYQTLVASLRTRWGDDLANLLTQAWHSDTMGECPTLGKWLVALPDEVPVLKDVRPPVTPIQEGASADIARLILDGDRAANKGEKDKALQLYQQALEVAPADIAVDLRSRIESLGDMKSREVDRPCPHCRKAYPAKEKVCPFCEKGRGKLVEEKIKDEVEKPKRRIPVWGWLGIGMVIVILGITAVLSGRNDVGSSPTLVPETPTPTSTSTPTITPTSTSIPISTSTPTIAPTPTPFSGGSGQIAFVYNYEIYVMDADGTNERQLTSNGVIDIDPAWSPDGSQITFASYRNDDYEIYLMDADGSNERQLTGNGVDYGSPAWSPDGSQIAFVSSRDGDDEIYVMDADGSNERQLTSNGVFDDNPDWSPDGSQIAVEYYFEIYVMDSDGTNKRRLTSNDVSDLSPAWSPDGSQIAFSSNRDGDYEIYVMDADGTNERQLTNNGLNDGRPTWSPDGSQIAFISFRDGDREIYVMDADGSNERQLTSNGVNDISPAWSP